MKTLRLTAKDYVEQLWKNGKGITREIARYAGEPYLWRVSWADLSEPGPFSVFPGYDRSLTLLSGDVTLVHDGNKRVRLATGRPHTFKGEESTAAVIEKPGTDLNVFALRGKARAAVYPADLKSAEETRFPLNGREHFLIPIRGVVRVLEPNENRFYELGSMETLRCSRITAAERLNLRASATTGAACLWIVIHLT